MADIHPLYARAIDKLITDYPDTTVKQLSTLWVDPSKSPYGILFDVLGPTANTGPSFPGCVSQVIAIGLSTFSDKLTEELRSALPSDLHEPFEYFPREADDVIPEKEVRDYLHWFALGQSMAAEHDPARIDRHTAQLEGAPA